MTDWLAWRQGTVDTLLDRLSNMSSYNSQKTSRNPVRFQA
ncbi:hypothetical protein BN844_4136 [Pseudomonas sp. SHC52]|nr:hypothetical protein BN844_4136 [Pseudomonas sp. SHC52]